MTISPSRTHWAGSSAFSGSISSGPGVPASLEAAVAHLDLPAGSRVGVPTWTFVSTALSAVHAGHVPVLLDVDPDTLNLSPEALEAALEAGAEKARTIASATLAEVREAMGIGPPSRG